MQSILENTDIKTIDETIKNVNNNSRPSQINLSHKKLKNKASNK